MTQTTELPEAAPGRAARIAAIYAFAHWLIEHPEVPAPTYMHAAVQITPTDEVDESTRFAQVASIGKAIGATEYADGRQVSLLVSSGAVHGISITYVVRAVSDGESGRAPRPVPR